MVANPIGIVICIFVNCEFIKLECCLVNILFNITKIPNTAAKQKLKTITTIILLDKKEPIAERSFISPAPKRPNKKSGNSITKGIIIPSKLFQRPPIP